MTKLERAIKRIAVLLLIVTGIGYGMMDRTPHNNVIYAALLVMFAIVWLIGNMLVVRRGLPVPYRKILPILGYIVLVIGGVAVFGRW